MILLTVLMYRFTMAAFSGRVSERSAGELLAESAGDPVSASGPLHMA